MFKIWWMIAILVVVLVGAQIVARAASSGNATTAVDYSEITLPSGLRQACWHTICPGVTTMREAAALMNQLALVHLMDDFNRPNNFSCWGNNLQVLMVCMQGSHTVNLMAIREYTYKLDKNGKPVDVEPLIKMGDLVRLWGTPTRISAPYCNSSGVWFDNGAQTATEWQPYLSEGIRLGWELGPNNRQVQSITIADRTSKPQQPGELPWVGFIGTRGRMICGE